MSFNASDMLVAFTLVCLFCLPLAWHKFRQEKYIYKVPCNKIYMLKKSKNGSHKVHELGLGTYVRGRHRYSGWDLASISGERGGTSWKKTERMSFYLIRYLWIWICDILSACQNVYLAINDNRTAIAACIRSKFEHNYFKTIFSCHCL